MEIAKYFERKLKKRDLSNKSSNKKSSKKLCEGSLDNSACLDVSVNNEDPFTEGLKFPECLNILMKCMQNLESQVGQIFKMLEKTEDCQTKGECQLTDLAKGVDFITQKLDEYEDAITATLQSESEKLAIFRKIMDRQEQYSRGNFILIHGLKEEKNKSTDDRVLNLFREELDEDELLVDLERTIEL